MAVPDLQAEHYLPRWVTRRFVVAGISERWAPAIHREVLNQMDRRNVLSDCVPVFEACITARDALLLCELRNTTGLILFASQFERECLSILGGLVRRQQSLPVLVICCQIHEELVPVMFEAGADTVLYDVRNDIPVGDWCVRILCRHSGQ